MAFSFWYCFVLWLAFWFMTTAGWVEGKLFKAERPVIILFAVFLITWAGCVCFFAWIPIWWTRRKHFEIVRSSGRNATFVLLLLACTIYCAFAWDKYVADKLYTCTDSLPFVFLHPGDWVHGNYVIVPQSRFPKSMSEPDAIKEGWNIPKLWRLWWSWVAASIGVSALLSFLIWWPKTRKTTAIPSVICAGNAKS